MLGEIYTTILFQPIYNLLVFFYDTLPFHDIGIAIILVTLIVKGILFPLTFKSLKSQKEMQEIQPKIKEIQAKYKDDKEKLASELMAVYKNHNVNPLASCFPLLIQLPIFIALFQVLRTGLGEVQGDLLYSFVSNPGAIDPMFFGFIDLSVISIPFAILAAIAQYFQAKKTMARRPAKEVRSSAGAQDEDMMANMNRMMLYFMPIMTLVIGCTSLPGGVMLYWMATTVLTIVLYSIFLPKKKDLEDNKSKELATKE
ncbi:MAG: YidC/Oxa1 family membrane protein insertase [Patescibacteria group bacterium]|nr:YidC/Oxa1 family membrane protein insertase [Patescibacteria group bacterium]